MKNQLKENQCYVFNDIDILYKDLKPEDIQLINQNKKEIHYKKGETIYKQGYVANNIFLITKGLVKVFFEDSLNNLILFISPKNKAIGLNSLYGTDTFPYTITTYEDTVCEIIDINIFKTIISRNNKFAEAVIKVINQDTETTFQRFLCLNRKQLHGKVATILDCLATRVYHSYNYKLSLSRQDLADLTGMSVESVVRILKEFKDDNIIQTSGKNLKILNATKLYDIGNRG